MIEFLMTLSVANWIAIYGAAVATIVFIWNIYNWQKSRGHLKVIATLVKDHGSYTEAVEAGTPSRLIRLDVVNTGKEPVTITALGGMTIKPKWTQLFKSRPRFQLTGTSPSLPHTLTQTLQVHWLQEILGLEDFRKISAIYAQDSSGKFWYASSKNIRQINSVLNTMKQTQS